LLGRRSNGRSRANLRHSSVTGHRQLGSKQLFLQKHDRRARLSHNGLFSDPYPIDRGSRIDPVLLPNHTAWARLLADGVPTSPVRLNLYCGPLPRRPDAHRLIEISRMRFGRPRTEVEQRISRFLAA
jgi:hypothetical protein